MPLILGLIVSLLIAIITQTIYVITLVNMPIFVMSDLENLAISSNISGGAHEIW